MLMVLVACSSMTSEEDESSDTAQTDTTETKDTEEEPITIRIGCLAREEPDVQWVANYLKEKGYNYNIETVVISDMTAMNLATEDGDIDANYSQNLKYMNTFNENNGTHLVAYRPDLALHVMPDILISREYSTPEELPDGATVVVAADGSSRERELKVLEAAGLIKLADEYQTEFATILDVVENPKNIQFIDCDTTSRMALFEDCDAMVCPTITVFQKNDPTLTVDMAMYKETLTAAREYSGILYVVAEGNEDAEWLELMVEAQCTQEWADWLMETYDGSKLPAAAVDAGAEIDWNWE